MKTIVVVATKGGAGKTTTAVGLADALIASGYTARVLDVDPQGSACYWRNSLTIRSNDLDDVITSKPADFLVIDTPPGAHPISADALERADVVIAVSGLSPVELHGLNQQRRMIPPDLVVPTRYDRRRTAHQEGLELIRGAFGATVCLPIPASTIVERAQGAGEPIAATSNVAFAYQDLARRVLELTKP